MISFDYTIQDPMGLHARPAGVMVKELKGTPCTITLECGGRKADGKKLFAVMGMAVKSGETVTVTIDGEDEVQVKEKLETFFRENF